MPATAVVSGGHDASKAQNGHHVDAPSSRPAPMDVDAPSGGQNGWAGKGGAGGGAQQSGCALKERGTQSALVELEAHDPAAGPPTVAVALGRPGLAAAAVGAAGATSSAAAMAPQANGVPPAAHGSSQQQQQQQQQDDDSATAMEELEAILNRVAQLDAEGWFQAPVREQDAPRYYQIIKQPMCFQVMREKVRSHTYVNWQEVVRDFELICANAMKYNQRRSRIHKLALVMLRAGKKLLIEVETQGRKAIERLHPAGSAAAAAATAVAATPLLSDVLLSPALTPGAGTPGVATATSVPPSSAAALLDAAAAAPQPDPLLLEDPEVAGYSSFDDEATDLEDDSPACVHGSMPAGPAPHLPLQLASCTALRQPWSLACPSTAAPAALPLSCEWRAARAGVDWRARWLELRLRELHHQRARYQEQLAAAEAAEAQAAAAAAAAQQAPPPPPCCQPAPRRQVPELVLPALLEHPFFAEQLGAKRPRPIGPGNVADAAAVLGEPEGQQQQRRRQQMALAEVVNDPNYPARAHAALQLLDRRLALLRRQLVALQSPAAVAAAAPVGRLASAARLGYVRGMAPRRSAASLPRMRSGFGPDSETRAMKRRRAQEAEVAELLQGQSILLLPKFVERTNRAIDTPRVRTLSGAEQRKRNAAVEALAAAFRSGAQPDAAALAALDALCPGESDGEEGSSDEAFAARHATMEAEERVRYEAFSLAGGRDRNKGMALGKDRSKSSAKEPRSKGGRSGAAAVLRTTSAPARMAAVQQQSGSGGAVPGGATPASAPPAAIAGIVGASPTPTPTSSGPLVAAARPPKQQQQQQQQLPDTSAPVSAPAVLSQAPAAAAVKAEAKPPPTASVTPCLPEAAAAGAPASALPPAPATAPAAAAAPTPAATPMASPAPAQAAAVAASATAPLAAVAVASPAAAAAEGQTNEQMLLMPLSVQAAAQMAQAMAMAQVQIAAQAQQQQVAAAAGAEPAKCVGGAALASRVQELLRPPSATAQQQQQQQQRGRNRRK